MVPTEIDTSDPNAIRDTLTFLVQVGQIMGWYRVYQYVAFVITILMLMKLVSLLEFHERLRVITVTLRAATRPILHFIFIFTFVVLMFAMGLFYLFGVMLANATGLT